MRRFSLTDKLIIASFLISVVTIVIVASYSYYKAKAIMVDRSFRQLNSVRVIKKNLIEKFFADCRREVALAAASRDIISMTGRLNRVSDKKEIKAIGVEKNPFIEELLKDYYSRVFIVAGNGTVFFLKGNKSIDTEDSAIVTGYRAGLAKGDSMVIRDYKYHSESLPCVSIESPVRDKAGEITGLIVFEISPQAIDKIMLNESRENGLGQSGETYLVGPDYLMRSSSRFQDTSIMITRVHTPAADSALAGRTGTRVIRDYRGIPVLSSYTRIGTPGLHWALLSEIDYKEVLKPVYGTRNEIIIISIIIFSIVLMVVIVFSRKITAPLQKLIGASYEVGRGNLDLHIQSDLNDEIGELTDTFNKMVVRLKKQAQALEAERQKSLKSLFNGQEEERQRLSRELHDSLGQYLIGLKLKYESCIKKQNIDSEEFESMGLLFDQTIEEARRISNNLMPAALSEFGLVTAVRHIGGSLSDMAGPEIHYTVRGNSKGLSREVEIYLFRIIQEGLANIIKHAEAGNAEIIIDFQKDRIFVAVKDDGKGFDMNNHLNADSNGLNNIRDRVRLLGGRFSIHSTPGEGCSLEIELPIN